MIPIGLFSQLMLTILSVLIIFTYIKPSLGEMKTIQDNIAIYEMEQQKVTQVNDKLSTLKSTITNIPEEDSRRLLAYMPNEVDIITVPRDIDLISKEAGILLKDIHYQGVNKTAVGEVASAAALASPQAHVFELAVEGSYGQLKQFFSLVEQNAYPLEVREVSIARQEGGFLKASMKIQTYNRHLLDEVPPAQ